MYVLLYVLFMAQYAFINVDSGTMRALHPLNGTLLLLLGAWVTQRAIALARSPLRASDSERERRQSERFDLGKETA